MSWRFGSCGKAYGLNRVHDDTPASINGFFLFFSFALVVVLTFDRFEYSRSSGSLYSLSLSPLSLLSLSIYRFLFVS